ncbi:hypothetical protein [Methylobacterium sp. JK268]
MPRPILLSALVSALLGGALLFAPLAAAQGTLTPPAGQPRVTAPGGLAGRGVWRRPGVRHGHRRHHGHRGHAR